jgi:hypothetical protein
MRPPAVPDWDITSIEETLVDIKPRDVQAAWVNANQLRLTMTVDTDDACRLLASDLDDIDVDKNAYIASWMK